MFDRLKRSLVESFVGALALGWLFAWAILDFVSIFSGAGLQTGSRVASIAPCRVAPRQNPASSG
jgi:hypothetical protein